MRVRHISLKLFNRHASHHPDQIVHQSKFFPFLSIGWRFFTMSFHKSPIIKLLNPVFCLYYDTGFRTPSALKSKWVIPENIYTVPWTASTFSSPITFRTPKMCYPPCPWNSIIVNPPPVWIFHIFVKPFRPTGRSR